MTNLSLAGVRPREAEKCADSEDSSRPTGWNLNLLHTHLVTVTCGVGAPSVFLIALIGNTLLQLFYIFFLSVCVCACAVVCVSHTLSVPRARPGHSFNQLSLPQGVAAIVVPNKVYGITDL